MPYITKEERRQVAERGPQTAGQLNFVLTEAMWTYLRRNDGIPTYKDMNEILGILEATKMEFYRRVVAPYEDAKIQENGDVYVR